MALLRYNVRITRANGVVEYATTPSRTAKVRRFWTPSQTKATRYRREEAYTVQCSAATMNPDAVVEFVEAPEKTK